MKNRLKSSKACRDLIYILAPSYTGSTLLTFLLAQHKNIATVGELKATARGNLDAYYCSCGSLMRECRFWKKVTDKMQKTDVSFKLDDFGTHFQADSFLCNRLLCAGTRIKFLEFIRSSMLRLLPSCRRQLYGILERNLKMVEVICDLQQGEKFLDGSKDPVRLGFLNLGNYWNLKVIYLIRDGRGATNSYMRHHNVPMQAAAKEWCRTHRECDRIVQELKEDTYFTIHYEDLCTNPEAMISEIYDFLGLSVGLCDLRFKSTEHHILGNQMRLSSIGEIRLDEKWKSALTERDLEIFEQTAGRLNRSYGYQ